MVQMKVGCVAIDWYLFRYLYIPHGSDESLTQSFNTHSSIFFISHMVQMKVQNFKPEDFWLLLYIPHGSDESFSASRIN